ncbi:MAG: acyl-CoA thioesterase [Xanthomonadales bacterium]
MIAVFRFRHTVTPEEIDPLGHAGNTHYVRWMQDAAVAHSEALGWPLERFLVLGAGWVVRSHRVTYLRQALEREVIEVTTWVANMRRSTSLRKYEIRNASGDLLARAETDWAFIDYTRQRPVRVPEAVATCFPVVGESPTAS